MAFGDIRDQGNKKKCNSKHGEEEMVVEVVSVVECTSNAFIKFIAGKPAVPQKRGSILWMGSSQRFISKDLLFLKRQLSTAFQNATFREALLHLNYVCNRYNKHIAQWWFVYVCKT